MLMLMTVVQLVGLVATMLSLTTLPEPLAAPASVASTVKADASDERLQRGLAISRRSSVTISAMMTNAAPHFARTLKQLQATASLFREAEIVVVENGSNDGTPALLHAAARADPRLVVLSEHPDPPAVRGLDRYHRLAFWRNKYWDRVLKGNGRDDDYMIMIDTDGLDWCLQGLARALGTPLGTRDEWVVQTANGMVNDGKYYDALAFRIDGILPDTRIRLPRTLAGDAALSAAASYYPLDGVTRAVSSAFGGFAIYRIRAIKQHAPRCRYHGDSLTSKAHPLWQEGRWSASDCEHVSLHDCLRAALGPSSILMQPSLQVHYGEEFHHRSEAFSYIVGVPIILVLLAQLAGGRVLHEGGNTPPPLVKRRLGLGLGLAAWGAAWHYLTDVNFVFPGVAMGIAGMAGIAHFVAPQPGENAVCLYIRAITPPARQILPWALMGAAGAFAILAKVTLRHSAARLYEPGFVAPPRGFLEMLKQMCGLVAAQ